MLYSSLSFLVFVVFDDYSAPSVWLYCALYSSYINF